MLGVPTKILVGPTTYVHFRRKHKDYYVPDFLASPDFPSPDQSPHVWRYTVSVEHRNTVFFYNAVSKKSVWVLPVVYPDGHTEELGEEEAMRAVREPTSLHTPGKHAKANEKDTTKIAAAVSEGKSEEEKGATSNSSVAAERQTTEMQNNENDTDSAGNPAAASRSTKPATLACVSIGPSAEARTEIPSHISPSNSVSRERVQAAVLRAQEAIPLTISISAGASAEGNTSANGDARTASLQQRLAAWRAKRHQSPSEMLENGATPLSSPFIGNQKSSTSLQDGAHEQQQVITPSPTTVIADPLLAAAASTSASSATTFNPSPTFVSAPESTPPVKAASASPSSLTTPQSNSSSLSPSHKRKAQGFNDKDQRTASAAHASTVSPQAKVTSSPSSSNTFVNAATLQRNAQDAELARVAALLHREKIIAMEQERAALECRRRAAAVEQQEAEERVRMMEVQAATERRRAEAQERRELDKHRKKQILESAAAEARVREVNQHALKHRKIEEEAEAAVADSFSYAARIAAQLAASAPRPEEIQSVLRKKIDAVWTSSEAAKMNCPTFREQHVGRGSPNALTQTTPLHMLQHNTLKAKHKQNNTEVTSGASAVSPAPTRTQECICYGMPFIYNGDVVDYKPARSFMSNTKTSHNAAVSKRHSGALGYNEGMPLSSPASSPDRPVLLTAKRDGAGTQYYDANRQHFFTGEWRDDKREGAGVLSLPNSAVQGHWQKDQLTGAAVVQTKRAKANATFSVGSVEAPSTSHPSTKAEGSVVSTKKSTLVSPHTTLNGNAAVELDNNALFVGALKDGRVGAPYVLQLGEGDYIEWLGPSTSASTGKAATDGRKSQRTASSPARKGGASSSLVLRGKPSASRGSGTAAGCGEGRIRFRNGDTYIGHVRDFQLHGMGYYRFAADGQSYTGAFQHGLPHGEGLMIFANGDLYKGSFGKGLFDGVGTYSCKAGGYVYEGSWVAGSMSGVGVLSYANGDVWEGTFRDNTRLSGAYTTVA